MSRTLAFLPAVAALAACATVGFQDPAQRAQALAAFSNGEAVLACGVGINCMVAWDAARPGAQNLARVQRWYDLAEVVIAAGYDEDLPWYYLGVAAQGLGEYAAARTYYDRAIRDSLVGGLYACNRPELGVDFCDGVNLPDAAQLAMASLPEPVAHHVHHAVRHAAVHKPAPASSPTVAPSPAWVAPVATPAAPAPASSSGGWVAPVPGGTATP